MNKKLFIALLGVAALTSCNEYNKLYKSTDNDYKYEAAKAYFAEGQYSKATTILNEQIGLRKGSTQAEESLFLLGLSYMMNGEYSTAALTFQRYYKVYMRGQYVEQARYNAGRSLYLASPEARLDQGGTYSAIQELQLFLEFFPNSDKKEEVQNMIFELQDKLVMKEYLAAKLYYNLGTYMGNNYLSAIITAENALKEYPYTYLREDLSLLVLKAKYQQAENSVAEKREERYRETVDEYYGFKNEFPNSKYIKEVEKIYEDAKQHVTSEES